MRPGGTQIKHGAAVRMRRRLGLAPRAYALLSCSLVLVIAGVSAYGMTVPSMMQAHAAREPRVGHEVKSDLGTTTGYAWASVVGHIVFGTDDADGAEAPDNEVTLANGKTIVLTNTKIIDRLSNNSVAATVNKVEQQKEQDAQQSGKPGSSDTSGSGSDSSSSGGGSGSGSSTGGSGNGGSTGGNTDNDTNSGGLSAAEEESIHSWLVTKYNMLTDDIPDLRALRMSPAIDVYAAASTVYELIAGVAPYEAAPSTSGTSGSRKKTRDIASPYRLKMDTRPDYPIGAHAPGCDLTQLLRREPDVALAAAEQAQQLGLEPDSEELRDALAFVDAQLFDVVMACLSSHQKDRPEPAAVEAALSAFCDHYAQNVGRSLRGEPLTPCPMDASGRAVRRALMIGAAVVCSVVWAVVVVSAALLASGARVTAILGSLVWSGSLPGIIAALALALPGIAGVAAGALARDRRSGFLQGVLALSACEVPVLVVAACSVFSQRAVMGGLVAALVATYTLTWFLLAMGFAFELPVSAPRRTKAQMATPLAGGAAAARTFGGPVEVSSDSISTTKEA